MTDPDPAVVKRDHPFMECPRSPFGCRRCHSCPDVPVYGKVLRDGVGQWQFKCPGCQIWGDIDFEQMVGAVSIDCPNCDYHETVNLHRRGLELSYVRP